MNGDDAKSYFMKLLEKLKKCEPILNLLVRAVNFFARKNKKDKSTAPYEPSGMRVVRRTRENHHVTWWESKKDGIDSAGGDIRYEKIEEEFENPDDKEISNKSDDK